MNRGVAGSSQGGADHLEGICAFEASGVDCRSHVRFGLRGPHGAVAIGDLSLDHAGTELSFGLIVGDVDLAGKVAKGQKLAARPSDFGLQFPRQIAAGRRGQQVCELFLQAAFLARQRRGGKAGYVFGQIESPAEPKLEPKGQIVRAMLQRESCVARQMGLMPTSA